MYKIDFLPYNGAGQIKLGSAREEARKTLGTFKEFTKTKSSKNTTDDFSFCHVFYNEQNKVEAVEFFDKTKSFDTTEFLFKGENLFLLSLTGLKSLLKSSSIDFQEQENGSVLRSDAIGLSVFSPDKEKIETILIYKKGYYD